MINGGLLIWAVSVLVGGFSWGLRAGSALMLAGTAAWLGQLALHYRSRNRVRADARRQHSPRRIDYPFKFAIAALAAAAAAGLMGAAIEWFPGLISGMTRNRLVTLYGGVFLLGFLSLLTLALLHKIVPYLLWLRFCGPVAGRRPVPRIDDLMPRAPAVGQLSLYCAGTVLVLASLAVDWSAAGTGGAWLIAASGLWLVINMGICWRNAARAAAGAHAEDRPAGNPSGAVLHAGESLPP